MDARSVMEQRLQSMVTLPPGYSIAHYEPCHFLFFRPTLISTLSHPTLISTPPPPPPVALLH